VKTATGAVKPALNAKKRLLPYVSQVLAEGCLPVGSGCCLTHFHRWGGHLRGFFFLVAVCVL
jgi:hypothetical protein